MGIIGFADGSENQSARVVFNFESGTPPSLSRPGPVAPDFTVNV